MTLPFFGADRPYQYDFPDEIIAQQAGHPLLRGLYLCRAGFYPRFAGHYTERPQGSSDSHILIYCTEGEGWYTDKGGRWAIGPGQLCWVVAGLPHAYGADVRQPWTIYWAHLNGGEVGAFRHLLGLPRQGPVMSLGEQLEIIRHFQEMLHHCRRGYSLYLLLKEAALLRQILSSVALQRSFAAPDEKGLDVEAIIQYMLSRLPATFTVAELAGRANLSISHFSRLFQQKSGYAPMDYFIRLKMQKACELLTTTGRPVKGIAADLGYRDPYYFSRLFRKIVGVSPSQYRQRRDAVI